MLREVQAHFHQALLGGDPAPLLAEIAPGGVPAARRLAVHRNTFYGFLTEALEAAFPVVHRLVGTDFFRAAAVTYIRAEPPAEPRLASYGGGFARFLAAWPPAQTLAYLPDVAALDWARVESGFAADADPLDPARLAALPPDRLAGVVFRLHPTLRVVASGFPIQTIWQAHQSDPVESVDLEAGGETVLVLRPGLSVGAETILPADAALLEAIAAGRPLLEAAAIAADRDPRFDLQAALAAHLRRGTFAGITTP